MRDEKVNGLTFQQWLCEIDVILVTRVGLSASDGLDWPAHDAWEDGLAPDEALTEIWMTWQDFPDLLSELLSD